MTSTLTGKVVLVTGAAGGIGTATARRFAERGAELVLVDRRAAALEEVSKACAEYGAAVTALEIDQTDREQVDRGVGQALAAHGRIDVLFANAGYGRFAPFLASSVGEWTRHVDVNLNGTFHVCQAVARAMVEGRRGGAIVVNASSGAQVYSDQLAAYCVTKAALRMLAVAMASELGGHGIRCTYIMPGVIESPMTASMLEDDGHRQTLLANTPLGRLGAPDDVARLVTFLASDDAAFITGSGLGIDGGQTIHGHPRWFALDYRRGAEAEWEVA